MMLTVIVFAICVLPLAEATAAEDCNTCTDNLGNSTECSKIKTYISCLIDTHKLDKTKAGCSEIKTKMDEAATLHNDNCGSDPVTGTCLCEMKYYQRTNLDCEAIKAEITCLFPQPVRNTSCDGTTLNHVLVGNQLKKGKAMQNCISDTCNCQASFHALDTSNSTYKCMKFKERMHCLVTAHDIGCDNIKNKSLVATKTFTKLSAISDCASGLSQGCKCVIAYDKTDFASKADNCTAAKMAKTCLSKISSTSDKVCDGATATTTFLSDTFTPLVSEVCGSGGDKTRVLNSWFFSGFVTSLTLMLRLQ